MPMKSDSSNFRGFKQPESNYSALPNEFIDLLPQINAITEMKVIIYLLRHTWGYQEYDTPKKITIDEFVNGRKRKDGTRMDAGTGLSEQGVRNGIDKAIEHDFISVTIDESDKARVKKFYCLSFESLDSGVQTLDPDPQSLDLYPPKVVPRSEKETIGRNLKKEKELSSSGEEVVKKPRAPIFTDIIKGWADQPDMELAFNPYVNKPFRKAAQSLFNKGIRIQDVLDFIEEKKTDETNTFWADKPLSFNYICENILTWKKAQGPDEIPLNRQPEETTHGVESESRDLTPEEQAQRQKEMMEVYEKARAARKAKQ